MSTLYVDNLIEKSSGHGVHIPGHVVNVTTASYNNGASYSANTSYVNTATVSYTHLTLPTICSV